MKIISFIAFKIFAITTFSAGFLLHILGLYYGQEYFLKNILTYTTDMVFSIPMTLAATFSWLSAKQIDFKTKLRKTVFYIMAVYLTISVPIHLKSWFTNDMEQIAAFPEEYSYFILPIMFFLLLFTISLKKKTQN